MGQVSLCGLQILALRGDSLLLPLWVAVRTNEKMDTRTWGNGHHHAHLLSGDLYGQ